MLLLSLSLLAKDKEHLSNFPFDDITNDDQETQTLFGTREFHFSGFGGMYSSMTIINGQYTSFFGGRGAAIINDFFVIGGGGCGLVYPESRSQLGRDYGSQETSDYIGMGYGGMLVGFNIFQKSILNLSVTSIIGNGEFYLAEDPEQEEAADSDSFFVAEPMVMLHINITRWMRVGCGVSYLYTRGIHTEEFSDSDFTRPTFVAAVDFGWF